MNYNEVARQLKDNIRSGRENETRQLLEPFTNPKEVQLIEDKFVRLFESPKDPINYAIECKKEKLAVYLVEKAFSLDHLYWEDKAECDDWCVKDHGPDKCPRQYDCSRNAEKHHMEMLKLRLDAIKQGKRRPGEGISEPYIDKHMPHTPPPKQNRLRSDKDSHNRFISQTKGATNADIAREVVDRYGYKFFTKSGQSLLHLNVDQPSVYIYILANHGVPVNIQDKKGDTALHLAVRKCRLEAVEALVHCSADLTVRNEFGRTPIEEAEGAIKKLLRAFEPGVVHAVRHDHYQTLYRHYKRCWSNVHTKVKGDQSILEMTEEAMNSPDKKKAAIAKNSFRILNDYKPTSELIHAVLCEDVELARRVLEANQDLSVNLRFRDRIGKTLLSHAIEVNNYDLVKLLIQKGAHVAQIRVRESEQTDVTVPLYQKALRKDLDVNIVKLLQTVLPDSREHEEKDVSGNTPLLRAIEEGVDSRTIHWLITVRGGYSLLDRNMDGFTARELADKRGRENVVKVIDRYLTKEIPPIVLRMFPISFYSVDLLTVVDETGDSLEQRMNKAAEEHNMKTWVDFNTTQNHAIALFTAAAKGDCSNEKGDSSKGDKLKDDCSKVDRLNNANYQDKNGYTALIRAIVFNQPEVADKLCLKRPALKRMPDNCNRYPLHYAYALPEEQGKPFIKMLLEIQASEIENRVDKNNRVAAEYRDLRKDKEILQMLYDARTLDAFGKRGAPIARWPAKAETSPPEYMDDDTQAQQCFQQSQIF